MILTVKSSSSEGGSVGQTTAVDRAARGLLSNIGSMPTVLRSGPYRFHFYSNDLDEPPHVHVERDRQSAKFWLAPVMLARNIGFSDVELRRIHELVVDHGWLLMEAWNEYFGD